MLGDEGSRTVLIGALDGPRRERRQGYERRRCRSEAVRPLEPPDA